MSTTQIRCNHCFATIPATTAEANAKWKEWHMATKHADLLARRP